MPKSRDAFRTISEVADWLETPAHVLRFWESKFSQVKPVKRAGGRRYYRPADMELLSGIKKLLHDDGMTIKGVQKVLREQGVRHVAALAEQPVDPPDGDASELIEDAPYTEIMLEDDPNQVIAFPREAEQNTALETPIATDDALPPLAEVVDEDPLPDAEDTWEEAAKDPVHTPDAAAIVSEHPVTYEVESDTPLTPEEVVEAPAPAVEDDSLSPPDTESEPDGTPIEELPSLAEQPDPSSEAADAVAEPPLTETLTASDAPELPFEQEDEAPPEMTEAADVPAPVQTIETSISEDAPAEIAPDTTSEDAPDTPIDPAPATLEAREEPIARPADLPDFDTPAAATKTPEPLATLTGPLGQIGRISRLSPEMANTLEAQLPTLRRLVARMAPPPE